MYIKTTCAAYNPEEVFDDLKEGCTGDISEGDTILRNWALKTPPRGCDGLVWSTKNAGT